MLEIVLTPQENLGLSLFNLMANPRLPLTNLLTKQYRMYFCVLSCK